MRATPISRHAQTVHGAELLTIVGIGIIIVRPCGGVVYMNSLARRVCESSRGLSASGGVLAIYDAKCHAAMLDLIRNCAEANGPESHCTKGNAIKVQRPGELPLMVLVGRYDSTLLPADSTVSMATLMIVDPQEKRQLHELHLTEWFGLTRAEAELACALANGERLESFSSKKGVKISTVRTQLSSVLSKTGMERQSDLVGLLARLPSLG
jgi:DNA-binding CsgD family transcriptional regulator